MKKIVVLSGAGMSAESGIDTFRKSGGLWETFKIEEVATPEAWRKNPKMVQEFYNMRRQQISAAQPNEGHKLLALFEQFGELTVITQNIDDLHERAGVAKVIHLHGNIRYAKSSGPKQEEAYYPIEGDILSLHDLCPDGYPLRPHVVWFGEDVPLYKKSQTFNRSCRYFCGSWNLTHCLSCSWIGALCQTRKVKDCNRSGSPTRCSCRLYEGNHERNRRIKKLRRINTTTLLD